jgi:hypothetical protein
MHHEASRGHFFLDIRQSFRSEPLRSVPKEWVPSTAPGVDVDLGVLRCEIKIPRYALVDSRRLNCMTYEKFFGSDLVSLFQHLCLMC